MSQYGYDTTTFDRQLKDEDHLGDVRRENSILIPPLEGNGVSRITSVNLHLLQIKGLFGDQANEDENIHLNNFIDVCNLFDISHIYKIKRIPSWTPNIKRKKMCFPVSL